MPELSLSSSFDTMLAALHESVTAQRQLVADASHELRTPLTSLTTNLDLLEDGAGLADPQAAALVRAAREQASNGTVAVRTGSGGSTFTLAFPPVRAGR